MNNDKYDNRANSSIRDLTSSEWIEQPPLNYIVVDGADRIVTAFFAGKGHRQSHALGLSGHRQTHCDVDLQCLCACED